MSHLSFVLFNPKHTIWKFKGVESSSVILGDARLTKEMGSMPIPTRYTISKKVLRRRRGGRQSMSPWTMLGTLFVSTGAERTLMPSWSKLHRVYTFRLRCLPKPSLNYLPSTGRRSFCVSRSRLSTLRSYRQNCPLTRIHTSMNLSCFR
jgi:hypothetical protein